MAYNEEDYLQLSGLQHFLFCRRQWALIHLENQWAENYRTADGRLMHKHAHDAGFREKRGDLLIVRAMRVHSAKLGFSGECDVIEFHRDDARGVPLAGEDGRWQPYPIEYKRGVVKIGAEDEAQLCAQAICLEEMLCCEIREGALYYGGTKHRQTVTFSTELRETVGKAAEEMHALFQRGHTPKVKKRKGCDACSLKELCLPELSDRISVDAYLRQTMRETK